MRAHRLASVLLVLLLACRPGEAAAPQVVEVAWTEALPQALSRLSLVETWLSIDPTDPGHLVGAAMAVDAPDGLQSVVLSSRDGGRSWLVGRDAETGGILFPEGDPMTVLSPGGTPFLTTLHEGFTVWRAEEGDTLWRRVGRVPGNSYDRQWLAFDRSGGENHGRLYSAGKIWIQVLGSQARDVAAFSWSDAEGESFHDPELVLPDPSRGSLNIVSQIQVLSDGTIVAPYHLIVWPSVSRPPSGSPEGLLDGEIAVIRSQDGRRWEEPVRVGPMRKWGHGDEVRMFKGLGAGGLAVGLGPDGGERLHLVWLDVRDAWLQVMTAHSADGGQSWSDPVRVGSGGLHANQGNPGIAVDGLGQVAVVWNDRRSDPTERCFESYVAVSRDGGQTFSEEVPVSDTPVCLGVGRWMGGGDTQGIVGLPEGGFQLLWVGAAASRYPPVQLLSSRIVVR